MNTLDTKNKLDTKYIIIFCSFADNVYLLFLNKSLCFTTNSLRASLISCLSLISSKLFFIVPPLLLKLYDFWWIASITFATSMVGFVLFIRWVLSSSMVGFVLFNGGFCPLQNSNEISLSLDTSAFNPLQPLKTNINIKY